MIKKIKGLIDFVCEKIKLETDIAILGLSGGADSTLVSLFSVIALGPENVYTLGMPYGEIDINKYNARSKKFAQWLKTNYKEVKINNMANTIYSETNKALGNKMSKLTFGNLRSRIRMSLLYSYCATISEEKKVRCRVLGTGNLSEDFIGYDTKGGDALADFFPIGSLFKSEIYQLLDYFSKKNPFFNEPLPIEFIDKVPSAGLWNGQTDESELGYSYDAMEPHIKILIDSYNIIEMDTTNTEIEKFVWDMHLKNRHKHQAPKTFNLREFCDWTDSCHTYFGDE